MHNPEGPNRAILKTGRLARRSPPRPVGAGQHDHLDTFCMAKVEQRRVSGGERSSVVAGDHGSQAVGQTHRAARSRPRRPARRPRARSISDVEAGCLRGKLIKVVTSTFRSPHPS
jgi:hypothetical protein